MSRKRDILFIGAVNAGNAPQNGEEAKNQMLLAYLEKSNRVRTVDTMAWKKDPRVLATLLYTVFVPRYDTILLSASSASVHTLLQFMKRFRGRMSKTVYFVIGGYLPKGISEGRYRVDAYQALKAIVVEGEGMRRELLELGVLAPMHVVPNFKRVDRVWGEGSRYDDPFTRFIFVSRVTESKGVSLVFEALREERLTALADRFAIDFYGPVDREYKGSFEDGLRNSPNCSYKGYLDIANRRDECYGTMSSYHAMLFPTFWVGEGFPGVVVDALACGIPVIASDWNMNAEVVKDGFTGRIVPYKDAKALAEAMADAILNRDAWRTMSANCHRSALCFDTDTVLDDNIGKII